MGRTGRFAYPAALALLGAVLGGCGGGPTLSAFSGSWQGHGRGLSISRDGVGRAEVYSGCCDFVLAVRFRLTRPHAAAGGATATETAIAVRIGDRSAFGGPWHPPRVGESATLRLKDGVITDPLSGANYCGVNVKHWVCGA
jgi:hypothetical protein